MRPGEKLFEEILAAEEGTVVTNYRKIFIARDSNNLGLEYIEMVEDLIREARNGISGERVIAFLKELVPAYQPNLVHQIELKDVEGYQQVMSI
jgi:FlaA1/EpsC-like NDP-sugar epimerase